MKQYVIDEIRDADYTRIQAYLDAEFGPAEMGGIYWLPVAQEMLSAVQKAHPSCGPFYVALDLEPGACPANF